MRILVFLTVLLIPGCGSIQEFENVGVLEEYKGYIGSEYAFVVEMHISGVNAPPGYGKEVNYYTVNPSSPSWGGPEVITRQTLLAGSTFVIESIHRCTNCTFGLTKLLRAKILLPNYTTEFNLPIHIPLQYVTQEFVEKVE